jgi:hypothetical protein
MSESLLVGSKTRAALKANGVNVGAGALDALNEVVHWYIDQAAKRAAANRRKTVRGHDFVILEEAEARPAEPPAPAPAAGDSTQAPAGDVADAGEESAEEAPPAAWSG